jgi:hypothetical protein
MATFLIFNKHLQTPRKCLLNRERRSFQYSANMMDSFAKQTKSDKSTKWLQEPSSDADERPITISDCALPPVETHPTHGSPAVHELSGSTVE